MAKRRSFWVVLVVVLLACLLVQVPVQAYAASTYKVSVSVTQSHESAQRMLKLINKRRKKAGLPAVKLDVKLTKAAIQRAAEVGIYTPQESPHRRPNGQLARTITNNSYEICCEAYNFFATEDTVMDIWMKSPSHKAGILLKSARSVGIACTVVGPESYVWVCEFNSAKASQVLKSTKQKVPFNRTVAAKSSYMAKKYFRLGSAYYPSEGSSGVLFMGYSEFLAPVYDGPYITGPTTLNAKSFTWKSSNPKVATVSASGKVTPKKKGKVTITATMKNRTNFKLKQTFEVRQ